MRRFSIIAIVLGTVEFVLILFAIYLIKQMFNSIDIKMVEAYPIVIEEEEEVIEEPKVITQVKSDIDVIAEVVQGEAGNQEMIGKVAVAMTMLNRMDRTGRSAESIAIEAYNAYPYYGPVSADSYRAVEIAMENRDLFPDDMMYFRAGNYHDFGVPYMQIQDHYFSTKE
jgi:hypothetical protein